MISASFMSKTLIVDDRTFKYQIWDTAGQEKVCRLFVICVSLFGVPNS